jgi:U1 small nuclear ribonucleoprotein
LHFLCYVGFSPDAYKQADGRKVDNKRVLVDVERGRTVPNWRPRRLGGGLGSSRMGGAETDKKDSTRYIVFFSF